MSKSEKKVLKSMAENNEKKGVDLSSLTELDFSPNWDNKKSKSENLKTKVVNYGKKQATALEVMTGAGWK